MTTPRRRAARGIATAMALRSEEHTSELQSRGHLVCRLLLEKKNADVVGVPNIRAEGSRPRTDDAEPTFLEATATPRASTLDKDARTPRLKSRLHWSSDILAT